MIKPDRTGTFFGGTQYATTSPTQAQSLNYILQRRASLAMSPEARELDRKEALERGEIRSQRLEEAAARMKLRQVQNADADTERRKRRKRALMQAMDSRSLQPSEKLELAELQDVSVS